MVPGDVEPTGGVARVRPTPELTIRPMTSRSLFPLVAWGGLVAACVYLFWPPSSGPVIFPDTLEYLHWPRSLQTPAGKVMGARPVGYPAVLALLGATPALSHVQTWLSVFSWGLLGWTVWRAAGLLFALALAYSSPVRLWNGIALTESMTLSLLVLTMALVIHLARAWSWWVYAAWLLSGALFVLLRDANIVLVPFLSLPLIACGRRRLTACLVPLAMVSALAVWHADAEQRWLPGYRTSIWARVLGTPEAQQHFREAGMPENPLGRGEGAFLEWMTEDGRQVYLDWVLRQRESYSEPWEYLYRGASTELPAQNLVDYFYERFLRRTGVQRGFVAELADRVFCFSALPLTILLLIAVVASIDVGANGVGHSMSLWIVVITLALLAHGFVTYNMSGSEHARHILASSILLRLVPLFVAAAVGARMANGLARR